MKFSSVYVPSQCSEQVVVSGRSLKDLQNKTNGVQVPAVAWANQLQSTLQPSVAPLNAALQALLTQSAAKVTQDVNANHLEALQAANDSAVLRELMKQGGSADLMSFLQPPQVGVNPYHALMTLQQQQAPSQTPEKMALIKLVEEQLKQRLTAEALSQFHAQPMMQGGGLPHNRMLSLSSAVAQASNPLLAQGVNQHVLNQGLAVSSAQGNAPVPSKEQNSRLKKKKKAHLLDDAFDTAPTQSSIDNQAPPTKQLKRDTSHSSTASTTTPLNPEDRIIHHILQMFAEHLPNYNLQHHHGVQCLIRELIASSLSRRSFDLLSKASDLAVKVGINMDQILCTSSMHYLLPMLLEPRSNQVNQDQLNYVPVLPPSLLACIGPSNCTSFDTLNVGNRWIMIREVCQGKTKLYGSPVFEQNVMTTSHMRLIAQDTDADVFALLFAKEQYEGFLECVANQIALRLTEDLRARPVRVPSKVRLLSQSFRDGQVPTADSIPMLDVEMMVVSIQTLDSHFVSYHGICCLYP